MSLHNYEKRFYADLSEKTLFQKDILEKVHRLISILEYINSNPEIEGMLALKGGTPINMIIFNMPRLSVDIDLDFSLNATREEMLRKRNNINILLKKYFESEGYTIEPKSKTHFSLDSWVIGYTNTSGNHDNLKVEINYSLRQHILPIEKRGIGSEIFTLERKIYCLSKIELIASKITALLNRIAARDFYDIYNIIKYRLVELNEIVLLRKCIIFYKLISSEDKIIIFDTTIIDKLTKHKIKTDLLPLLRKKESFDLDASKKAVKEFIDNIMVLTPGDKVFIDRFMQEEYVPEILFDDKEIINRIINHPMAIWKINNIKNGMH